MRYLPLLLLLALAACGSRGRLTPADGSALPVAPYAATATPTPDQLLTPSVQARPQRSDELLTRSEERKPNDFDLPPN